MCQNNVTKLCVDNENEIYNAGIQSRLRKLLLSSFSFFYGTLDKYQ
jgi:hypothetical protein